MDVKTQAAELHACNLLYPLKTQDITMKNIAMESFIQGVKWANRQMRCVECGGMMVKSEVECGDYHPDHGIIYHIPVMECLECGECVDIV